MIVTHFWMVYLTAESVMFVTRTTSPATTAAMIPDACNSAIKYVTMVLTIEE